MTPAQTKLYWKSWSAAKKAGHLADADRARLTLEALGYEASSKSLTNAEFDKVLAAFRAISAPYSLKPQLRAQEQPNTRRLHKIANLLKCLGLFVAEPVPYASAILRDRFHVSVLEDLARVDLNAELIADKSQYGGTSSGSPTCAASELEKLIFTLSRCVSVLRRKGVLHAGGARSTVPQITEHEMCRLAKVPCFRANCAACRDEKKNTVGARSTRDPLMQPSSINVAREIEMAHTTEEEPF
jgi:hypothetical protein